MIRKTIYTLVTLLALGSAAFAAVPATAAVRHGVFHSNAKCGVNSIIPGGTLRGISCRLR
jgi:hypothetical protein